MDIISEIELKLYMSRINNCKKLVEARKVLKELEEQIKINNNKAKDNITYTLNSTIFILLRDLLSNKLDKEYASYNMKSDHIVFFDKYYNVIIEKIVLSILKDNIHNRSELDMSSIKNIKLFVSLIEYTLNNFKNYFKDLKIDKDILFVNIFIYLSSRLVYPSTISDSINKLESINDDDFEYISSKIIKILKMALDNKHRVYINELLSVVHDMSYHYSMSLSHGDIKKFNGSHSDISNILTTESLINLYSRTYTDKSIKDYDKKIIIILLFVRFSKLVSLKEGLFENMSKVTNLEKTIEYIKYIRNHK